MKNIRLGSMIVEQDLYGPPPEKKTYNTTTNTINNTTTSNRVSEIIQTLYGVKAPEEEIVKVDNSAQIMSIILTVLISITVFIMGIVAVFNHKLSKKAKIITVVSVILVGIIGIVAIRILL